MWTVRACCNREVTTLWAGYCDEGNPGEVVGGGRP